MSEKSNEKGPSRHYTTLEREIFLALLVEYKDIVENKKSDVSTLKAKEEAWKNIVEKFNSSLHVSTQRNLTRLKKYWANLKQQQRDAKTKETQARMGTGGGPAPTPAEVDPTIELINPHLMERAPCAFSSNLTQQDLERNIELVNRGGSVMLISSDNTLTPVELVEDDLANRILNGYGTNSDMEENSSSPDLTKENSEQITNLITLDEPVPSSELAQTGPSNKTASIILNSTKKRKCNSLSLSSTSGSVSSSSDSSLEQEMKAERIRKITAIEEEIYKAKLAFELKCMEEKREHMRKKMKIEENIALAEERAAIARCDLAELELEVAKKRLLSK